MFIRMMTAALVAAIALVVSLPTSAGASSATPAPMPSLGCAAGDPVVWLNSSSKVYHESGDPYFGTTKSGKYMCKSAADAAGGHLAKGNAMKSKATMAPATPTPKPTKTPKAKKHPTPAPTAT